MLRSRVFLTGCLVFVRLCFGSFFLLRAVDDDNILTGGRVYILEFFPGLGSALARELVPILPEAQQQAQG